MSGMPMVVTDLDGTLLNNQHEISRKNLETLIELGKKGIVRVVATGRSLFSYFRSGFEHIPVDFIIFSSGAGVYDCRLKKILFAKNLTSRESQFAFNVLVSQKVDFSIQFKIPENHRFYYFQTTEGNEDFETRIKLYKGFCYKMEVKDFSAGQYCQMIAVCPESIGAEKYLTIKTLLPQLSVIRSTSPIDHRSVWIEIFNPNVSKLNGIRWLISYLKIKHEEKIFCCGNDYNDLDMLKAFPHAYVVGNAPDEIRSSYHSVATNQDDGFSEAIKHWLSKI